MTAQPHIVLARMSHETNTFSPVVTDLPRFSGRAQVPPEGADALRLGRGSMSCLSGFIEVCERAGVPISVAVSGVASPSGPVEDDAFEYMAERIVKAATRCDGMLLELHGAMVTRSHEDGEGELLRRIRHVAPQLPIGVALDMHANIYPDMVRLATLITGYHRYPHTDMHDAGVRAAELLLRSLRGEIRPVMHWANLPMLPHVMRQGTDDEPNRTLQARAEALEAAAARGEDGALAVSLFTGFPHADIREAGLSVVVVDDGDPARARRHCESMLDAAWDARHAFVYPLEPLGASMARARAIAEAAETSDAAGSSGATGPVVLLDHYDNSASGGTMDTTEVLAEILRQGLEDVAVFAIHDPQSVEAMVAAGVGNEVTLTLGARTPMPALAVQSVPLTVTGRVKAIIDGRFEAVGEANRIAGSTRGLTMDMGRSAVLDTGKVEIVVISRYIEPVDPGVFTAVGIQPERKRYLMLKSRIHYRRGFRAMAKAIVECAGVGVCTSDYGQLRFEHVRRPIWPLDGINAADWRELQAR
jgi:microcystin degradation protein MlrC